MNGWVISFHTLLSVWLLIHAWIKVNPCKSALCCLFSIINGACFIVNEHGTKSLFCQHIVSTWYRNYASNILWVTNNKFISCVDANFEELLIFDTHIFRTRTFYIYIALIISETCTDYRNNCRESICWFLVQPVHVYITEIVKTPESKVHGANMGPTWALSAPDDPHVGPTNLTIRDSYRLLTKRVTRETIYRPLSISAFVLPWTGETPWQFSNSQAMNFLQEGRSDFINWHKCNYTLHEGMNGRFEYFVRVCHFGSCVRYWNFVIKS